MPRRTKAQQIEAANEEHAMAYFEQMLGALTDPRRARGRRYPLRTVVVTALMAMVCGADDAEAMGLWGEANQDWLSGFLQLPHGAPSQDVYLSVFAALEPGALNQVFQAWAGLLALRLDLDDNHIAVDGKTSRGSASPAEGRTAIHTVSAWLTDAGLVLGQRRTADKSNEITAIPELLRVLDLRGATVTIDAMGCQTKIAQTIVDGGGAYVLSVKDNQPTLHEEVQSVFAEVDDPRRRSVDEPARPKVDAHETVDKAHGRLEVRRTRLCSELDYVTTQDRWPGLSYVLETTRERTQLSTGKTSIETAYHIGSGPVPSAEQAGRRVRRHWSIENELHWVLDMAFGEDAARHRAKNTAANFTTLRHFALSLVRQDAGRKVGVANSRKRAAWDRRYLIQLMTGGAA